MKFKFKNDQIYTYKGVKLRYVERDNFGEVGMFMTLGPRPYPYYIEDLSEVEE